MLLVGKIFHHTCRSPARHRCVVEGRCRIRGWLQSEIDCCTSGMLIEDACLPLHYKTEVESYCRTTRVSDKHTRFT